MAKKRDIELDDEFAMDNFDDVFGGDGGFDAAPPVDDRKPVTKLAGSFRDGVTSKISDPQFHRRIVEKSLPKGYTQAFDATEQVYHSARDLYDTAGKEVKKTVKDIKRLSGSVAKAYGGVIPERLRNKMVKWGEEAAGNGSGRNFDPDDMEMQAGLGDVFSAWQTLQNEEQAKRDEQKEGEDEAKDAVRDSINVAQQDQIASVLFGIRDLTKRQVSYQDQVTTAYRRKSLELQYKTLFAARKTNVTLEQLLDLSKTSYELIIKNTALPEVVKIKTSEAAQQMLKQRFFGQLIDPISMRFSGAGRKIVNRFKNNIKGFFTEIGTNIQDATGMMDMLGETMGEMGGGEQDSTIMAGSKFAANQAGSRLTGYGADKLAEYIKKKSKEDPRFATYGLALENMFMTNSRRFNNLALGRNGTGIEWMDKAFEWLGFEKEATRSQSPLIQSSIEDSLDQPVQWNLMAQRTLTEVIPEWLSSMDQKLGVIAFGSTRSEDRKFDFKTGTLVARTTLAERFREEAVGDKNLKGLRDSVEETVNALLNGARISDPAMVVLRRTILKMTIDNKIPEPVEMATDDTLYDTSDPIIIDEIKQAIRNTFKITQQMADDYELSQDKGTTKRVFNEGFRNDVEFQQRYNKLLKSQMRVDNPDIMKRALRQSQMQNNDILKQMSFIEQKDDGSIQLDWRKYIATVFPDSNTSGLPPLGDPDPANPTPTPPTPPVPPIPVPPVPPIPVPPVPVPPVPPVPTPTPAPDEETPLPPLPSPTPNPPTPVPPTPTPTPTGDPTPTPAPPPTPPTPDQGTPPTPTSSRWKRLLRLGAAGAAAAGASGAASASTSIGAVAGNLVLPALTVADGGLLLLTAGGIAAGKFAAKWWKNRRIQRQEDMSDLFNNGEQGGTGDAQSNPDSQRRIEQARAELGEDDYLAKIASHTSDIRGMLMGASVTMGWLDNINMGDLGIGEKLSWLEDKAIKGKRKLTELGGAALGKAKDYTMFAYSKMWQGASIALPWAANKAGQTKDYLASKWGPITDIYVKGKSLPALARDKIKLGVYVTENGTPIRNIKDIMTSGGNIYEIVEGEENPVLVLSLDDIKKGLYDFKGFQILKGLTDKVLATGNRVIGFYKNAWGTAKNTFTAIKDFITLMPDVYVKGEDSPRLTAYLLRDGKYIIKSTGKVIAKISDITGDVVHVDDPERVVLTASEIEKGLVDVNGEPLADLKDKLINRVKSAYRLPAALLKRGFKSVTEMFSTGLNKLWGWVKGDEDDEGSWSFFNTNKAVVAKLDDIYQLLYNYVGGSRVGGDSDGDGDRDNSSEDIRQRRKQEREDQRNREDETSRRGSRDRRNDDGDDDEEDKGSGIISKLFSSTAGKVLMAGGAMALANKFFGGGGGDPNDPNGGGGGSGAGGGGFIDEDGSINWTKTLGVGALGYGAYRGAKWGLGKIGQGIGWAARKTGGLIKEGVKMAGRGVINQVGRFAVGQAIRTGAVWAGTALASVISAPVLLTAAAVALVAYGGYQLYKKMKQNADPIVKFRMAQYGFDMEDSEHVTKLLDVEQALLKFVRLKEDGPAEITQGMSLKALLDIFGVDEKDKAAVVNWNRWFQLRFKPVFISHVTALGKQIGSKDLASANSKMNKSQKLIYMSQVHFTKVDGNPYLVMESPFPGLTKLEMSFQTINDTFKWAVSKIKATPDKRVTRTASLKQETERNQKAANATTGAVKAEDRVKLADLKVDGTLYGKVSKQNGFYLTGGTSAETSTRTEKMSVYGDVKGTEVKLDPNRKDTHVIKRVIEAGKGFLVAELSDGSVVKIKGNRNWRNNNPGNLEWGPYTKELGAIDSDGRFAVFPTYEMGRKAKLALLFGNKNYRNLSLTQAISRYAPAFENNTKGYQNSVLAVVGGQNKAMSTYTDAERAAILNAMEKVEGYKVGGIEVLKAGSNPPTKEKLDEAKQYEKKNPSTSGSSAGNQIGKGPTFNLSGGTTSGGVLGNTNMMTAAFGKTTTPGGEGSTGAGPVKFDASKFPKDLIELGKTAISKADAGVNIEGLREDFRMALYAMCGEFFKKTGRKVLVTSAYRDSNKQKALYAAFLARGKTKPLVAAPGKSPHEHGVAVDINSKDGTADALENLGIAQKYGFFRPLKDHPDLNKREAWHFEHRSFRKNTVKEAIPSVKKEPTAPATAVKPTTVPTPAPAAAPTVTASGGFQTVALPAGKGGYTAPDTPMPPASTPTAPVAQAVVTPTVATNNTPTVNAPPSPTNMGVTVATASTEAEAKLAQVQQVQYDNTRAMNVARMAKSDEQLAELTAQTRLQEHIADTLKQLLDIAMSNKKERDKKAQERMRDGSGNATKPTPAPVETKPQVKQPERSSQRDMPVSMRV